MAKAKSRMRGEVEVDEITVDGKRIRVRNQDIALDAVRLDPLNPRIRHTFALEGTSSADTEARVEERLWSDPDVHDLLQQVAVNRGLIERIIVRNDYTVVEGNCRTVVYRKLRERFPRDSAWQTIPARVLPDDITAKDIAILLGQMHVNGKNTWSPFEKAGHVYRLHKEFMLTQDEVATRLRISKSKVNQLVRAFEAMKLRYMPKYPGRASIRKFSYFEELFKNADLRDWAVDVQNLERFVGWVGQGRLEQGNQVRAVPAILKNGQALEEFEKNGFAAAIKIVEAENPTLTSPLFKAMVELTVMLEQARLDDILRVRKTGSATAHEITENLTNALARFRELSHLN